LLLSKALYQHKRTLLEEVLMYTTVVCMRAITPRLVSDCSLLSNPRNE